MGEQHQIFVITTANGRKHSLAVIHIQWLLGGDVLTSKNQFTMLSSSMLMLIGLAACSRVIQFLQDPENRDRLELDIALAETLTEEEWGRSDIYCAIPKFPFVTSCLVAERWFATFPHPLSA